MAELVEGALLGGRYRVVRRIGSGGMGAVYEAVQEDLGRRVAVKVVHPHLLEEPELLQRFRREAQAAAALGHPNIVQITDFSSTGETAFLVMEYLTGESLGEALRREATLPPQRVAFIASQMLAALEAAHRAGIVHRDVKPDNVFLTSIAGVSDVVKILDFGVAKLQGNAVDARLTTTGALLGTPAYMAPEQARGKEVDARADIYAVGACMYHALSGRAPFEAQSFNALLFAIAEDPPKPLSSLRPDVDPELAALVERALAKSPASRFARAGEMRDALAPWAQPSAGEREPAPPPPSVPTDPMAKTRAAPSGSSDRGRATPIVVKSAPPPATPRRLAPLGVGAALVLGVGFFAVFRMGEREGTRDDVPAALTRAAVPSDALSMSPAPAPVDAASTPAADAAVDASLDAAVAHAPAGPPRKATGGRGARVTYCSGLDNSPLERLGAFDGAASACFAAVMYSPVDHQEMGWGLTVDSQGRVVGVSPGLGERIPALDACMAGVLRQVVFAPQDGDAATISAQVIYASRAPAQ
jgi:serine/threonine-protein kinase